ncbi:DNA-binding response regulator, OmpR family, contains REC and winged-helix (wHTH) domain [Aeromonas sp. RU39B]|jgi:DNA-binding response OmpR family regulator|uniref:response regulator transcription factor n=1 Tax=Aeromonas sp. RU39B TaxID=1907416 RepID=UPI000955368C|nr:response regulator transcription factor [Aeromonas sp. RU39B]SIQ21782.1 DNA-binding response regulator, OmpR family, contains REC and winged-helix (wHTH) domain [Aeromonas sp. RU39B]
MMKNKILVVDDDPGVCQLLTDVLSEHVFDVISAMAARPALEQLQRDNDIALVLLDLRLPDMSGLQLLQQIRQYYPNLPVIMLTGLASESDMVVGLEMGADDYIGKPFVPRVVVARVKAVLRRAPEPASTPLPLSRPSGPGFLFDGWLLNTHTGRLHTPQGEDIELTQGEYSLLSVLLRNARRVLSREQLLEMTHSDALDVFDRTIDVLIMRLRRKIEPNPKQPEFIRTIRGAGYVLSREVQVLHP